MNISSAAEMAKILKEKMAAEYRKYRWPRGVYTGTEWAYQRGRYEMMVELVAELLGPKEAADIALQVDREETWAG